MATEDGYTRFACDRAEVNHEGGELPVVYLGPSDKERDAWVVGAEYIDKNGVKMKATLCPKCAEMWREMHAAFAKQLTEFMEKGRR